MNPILLLLGVVALLALTKKPSATTTVNQTSGNFDTAPIAPKSTPTPTGVVKEPLPIAPLSPPAEGEKPPYVYDSIAGGATLGAWESEAPPME